ncbi:MAG TPA: tetratricopeptide repeat protein, partial [Gemmatimonadales bacterium]|nr:tetratricopeptide repeat protein [Gemmatimonadales bacterium]
MQFTSSPRIRCAALLLGGVLFCAPALRAQSLGNDSLHAAVQRWVRLGDTRRREADQLAADRANLGSRVGFGKLERAVKAYQEALRIAPAHSPALHGLYEALVLLRDTTRMGTIALPSLRAAAAAGSTDPQVYFALGRAERLMGDSSAAVQAFRRYLELNGDPGPGLRDLAWSAYVAGDPVADSAYNA